MHLLQDDNRPCSDLCNGDVHVDTALFSMALVDRVGGSHAAIQNSIIKEHPEVFGPDGEAEIIASELVTGAAALSILQEVYPEIDELPSEVGGFLRVWYRLRQEVDFVAELKKTLGGLGIVVFTEADLR